jgi:hypothetical protein
MVLGREKGAVHDFWERKKHAEGEGDSMRGWGGWL